MEEAEEEFLDGFKELELKVKADAREVGQLATEAITRGSGQGKECY
jgi:hypothetical protein